MSDKTILVIDDSSTIRRLCDGALSRFGYCVILAGSAEDGLKSAAETTPDLILLDHQLPGTTGLVVCQELLKSPELSQVPVVVSSTLRKRAYVEYADLPNVIDMLPKPYTDELLTTTVANALDTGSLVIESQSQGSAVPEVMEAMGEPDLSGGAFGFSVREVIDFLNNGRRTGVLEVETDRNRYFIHVDQGRIQGITATGVPAREITDRLPDALKDLAPVLNVTLSNRGAELDGIVDLLDTKVLDPRLLRKLLRHQAAVLLITCYQQPLRGFRFDSKRKPPPLYRRLPLDISVLALLVEGALTLEAEDLPRASSDTVFARQPIRGQNLDRTGLAAQQARILGKLNAARSVGELASELNWEAEEARRVLYGLELAELISPQDRAISVLVYEHELSAADRVAEVVADCEGYHIKVVPDAMAAQVYARRSKVDAVVVDVSIEQGRQLRKAMGALKFDSRKWVATHEEIERQSSWKQEDFDACLPRPYTVPALLDVLDRLFQGGSVPGPEVARAKTSDRPTSREIPAREPTLCT